MKIVHLVSALLMISLVPNGSASQIVPDSVSTSDSTGLVPDSSKAKDHYDWNALSEEQRDGSEVFRETLKEYGLLRGVSDFMWQNSDYFAYSRGSYGSAWYGSLTGLNPRYLTVFMQGRPMRNVRKGKYDLSLIHEYNLTDARHGSATDLSQSGESSIGGVNFFIRPEFRNVNRSEFIMKRGRGEFDDINVVLTRRLSNNSALLIQGLIRDQLELISKSDLKYEGRKIFVSYERRSDNGWLTSYSLGHTFRRILLSGPGGAVDYGYETGGSLREVAFDHTLNMRTADDRSEITAYLSTIESKRYDGNRINRNNFDTFEDRSLSYYYGLFVKQRLFRIGNGGFYAGMRSELHNVDKTVVDEYEVRNLQRSYAFLSQRIGGGGFLSLVLNEGLSSDSQFGSDAVYSGKLNLKFSEQTKLVGEISKSVVDVPIDFQFLNAANFSVDIEDTLNRESLSIIKTDFVHTGGKFQLRAGYQSTEIRDPLTVKSRSQDNLEVILIDDYTVKALSGEIGLNILDGIKLGVSTWQNLDYDSKLPFARKEKSVAYGSFNRKFFESNLNFTLHGEWIMLGEGNRFTYDPALDFFIKTGGNPLPSVSLFNYWFTAEINSFTLFLRNDNLRQTAYELIDGYGFFGNDFFWGVKWEFIN